MNKFVLFSSLTAFTLVSGMASAVTLTNEGKRDHKVIVHMGGKKETVTLKSGASYDSKGKDASFTIGKSTVSGKGDESFVLKHGKIEAKKVEAAKVAPAAEPAKTAPAPVMPAPVEPAKPVDSAPAATK